MTRAVDLEPIDLALPKTMSAAVLEEFGTPDAHTRRSMRVPEPGPGEVLIRVHACGICGEDVLARRGELPHFARILPVIQGHEAAGEIVALGPYVDHVSVGRRVVISQAGPCLRCEFCRSGREVLCESRLSYGEGQPGGYAEYCVVRESAVVPIPDGVAYEDAAVASCAIGVGVHALRLANVQGGQRLLVTGASGGVGIHALQTARAYGLHTTAVTSSDSKVEALREYADDVIVNSGSLTSAVKTSGTRPDVILELTSGITFEQNARIIKRGGTIVVVGNVDPRLVELHPGAMIAGETVVRGSLGASSMDIAEALRLVAQGAVQPVVAAILPIAEIGEAHRLVETSATIGRVVVTHNT